MVFVRVGARVLKLKDEMTSHKNVVGEKAAK